MTTMTSIANVNEERPSSALSTVRNARRPIEITMAILLVGCLIGLSVICAVHRPSVGFDASVGLLTWQSMQRGSHFNHLRMVSQPDLAAEEDYYWSAHTPAQYLLPAMISRVLRAPIGVGITVLQILAVALGIAGYYFLYVRTFGFARNVALFACLIILCRIETLHHFWEYSGGALLLFAGTPYFIACSWACLKRRGYYLLLVPLIFLAGAFLKLSFALVALGVIAASIRYRFLKRDQYTRAELLKKSAIDLLLFFAFYTILYVLNNSKGDTTSHLSAGRSVLETVLMFCFSLAGILSNALSTFTTVEGLGRSFDGLWLSLNLHPSLFRSIPLVWIICFVASAAVVLLALRAICRRVKHTEYLTILICVVTVHAFLLTSFFLTGAPIAEERHFWPASALLLPGLLYVVLNLRAAALRGTLVAIICMQSVLAVWVNRYFFMWEAAAAQSQSLDLAFPVASQQLVDTIETLDADLTGGRNVFLFTDPSLTLLVRKNDRLIAWSGFERSYQDTDKLDHLILAFHEDAVRATTLAHIESQFPTGKTWQTTSMGTHELLCAGCGSLKPGNDRKE